MSNDNLAREIAENLLHHIVSVGNVIDDDIYNSILQVLTNWIECAAQFQRNEDFYRDLLYKCGELLGPEVYVSDDGSIQEEPICLKIPELIKKLIEATE